MCAFGFFIFVFAYKCGFSFEISITHEKNMISNKNITKIVTLKKETTSQCGRWDIICANVFFFSPQTHMANSIQTKKYTHTHIDWMDDDNAFVECDSIDGGNTVLYAAWRLASNPFKAAAFHSWLCAFHVYARGRWIESHVLCNVLKMLTKSFWQQSEKMGERESARKRIDGV